MKYTQKLLPASLVPITFISWLTSLSLVILQFLFCLFIPPSGDYKMKVYVFIN